MRKACRLTWTSCDKFSPQTQHQRVCKFDTDPSTNKTGIETQFPATYPKPFELKIIASSNAFVHEEKYSQFSWPGFDCHMNSDCLPFMLHGLRRNAHAATRQRQRRRQQLSRSPGSARSGSDAAVPANAHPGCTPCEESGTAHARISELPITFGLSDCTPLCVESNNNRNLQTTH